MSTTPTLVLWDIDRTLLYVGETDRQVYRETFAQLIGRPAQHLPERGTGFTMPRAIRSLLLRNAVPESDVPGLITRMVELLPRQLAAHEGDIRKEGSVLPGAQRALAAVHAADLLIPTAVTGNLKPSALIKLRAFGLADYLDIDIGGYASDNAHRPALVAVAQQRAQARHHQIFQRTNTVIIGDSLEDVRTGQEGGARVIAVASGTTSADELAEAGADVVLDDLTDTGGLLKTINDLVS